VTSTTNDPGVDQAFFSDTAAVADGPAWLRQGFGG